MYIYYVKITKKSETSAKLENSKNTNKVTVVNKQPSKLCIASQVNQTTDRDGKARGAIALQLVRAPSMHAFCGSATTNTFNTGKG